MTRRLLRGLCWAVILETLGLCLMVAALAACGLIAQIADVLIFGGK